MRFSLGRRHVQGAGHVGVVQPDDNRCNEGDWKGEKNELFVAHNVILQVLTEQPRHEEQLQHEETASIHNDSGHHRHNGQAQVLNGLTTEKKHSLLRISIFSAKTHIP
jgi:hypothetical protein